MHSCTVKETNIFITMKIIVKNLLKFLLFEHGHLLEYISDICHISGDMEEENQKS